MMIDSLKPAILLGFAATFFLHAAAFQKLITIKYIFYEKVNLAIATHHSADGWVPKRYSK
jgi:hypothetical protein